MQRIKKPKTRYEPSEFLLDEFKRAGLSPTPSKLKILDIFHENANGSLSAYDVYNVGQKKNFNLSMSTVYVSIGRLVSYELLVVTMFTGNEKKFRLNKGQKNSVIKCPHCGTFEDFDGEKISRLCSETLLSMNFSPEKCVFSIDALCNRCR